MTFKIQIKVSVFHQICVVNHTENGFVSVVGLCCYYMAML